MVRFCGEDTPNFRRACNVAEEGRKQNRNVRLPRSFSAPLLLALLLLNGTCAGSSQKLRDQDRVVVWDMVTAWQPKGWEDAGNDPCQWPGLVCGITTEKGGLLTSSKVVQFIKSLNLRDVCQSAEERGLGVECIIPESIGSLDMVEQVYLNGNGLHGRIPDSIGKMSALKALYLNANSLAGSIPPSLGMLQKLERLVLNGNHLTGSIPKEIGNCKMLHVLELQNNMLSGEIPPEIGMLHELKDLDLHDNELVGDLPTELGMLHNLHKAYFHDNHIFGSLPATMFGKHMKSLMKVDFRNNNLEGVMPYGLCSTPRLVYFEAEEGNDFEAPVLSCDGRHGLHADEANREHCKKQLRESGLCVNVPHQGLHDEL